MAKLWVPATAAPDAAQAGSGRGTGPLPARETIRPYTPAHAALGMHHRAPDRFLRAGLRVVGTRARGRPDRATRGPADARRWPSPHGRLVAQNLSSAAPPRRKDGQGPRRLGPAALLAILVAICFVAGCSAPAVGAESDRPVRILSGGAATLDPAEAGDAGSANVSVS